MEQRLDQAVTPAEPTVCGTCGTAGGGGVVLIVTRGRHGDHYEPTPCPACGTPTSNTSRG